MKINDDKLSQWKKRVLCTRFIYSVFVSNCTKEEGIEKFQEEIKPLYDNDINKVITAFFLNKDKILKLINDNLTNNWTLDRINLVDLSIIVEAKCEQIAHEIDKKIIIDQAIITCKKYSEKNSYKFVNSILDKILK